MGFLVMELRHLRYFVAVAEAGGLTIAAEQKLNTAQPSLSRQIRDLEVEVGAQLLIRSARGVELTAAGRAFLDHARLALAQAEAAIQSARRATATPTFALGFLTGQEMNWLPEAMHVLRDELAKIDVTVSSQYSPLLGDALMKGKLDLAFMRAEPDMPDLRYQFITKEPLIAVLPSDHRLAALDKVDPRDLVGERFIAVSNTAPTLKAVTDEFISQLGLDIHPSHVENFLPLSVTSRPLSGDPPTIDLVIGYNKTNTSPILRLFLSRVDDLISRCRLRRAASRG